MKTLLELNSPKYLRRLVREINKYLKACKPVYCKAYPFNLRVKKVVYGPNINKIIVFDDMVFTKYAEAEDFLDENGREICASRQ